MINDNGKYHSYTYYPGYKINKKQESDQEALFSYLKDKKDMQIFYNTNNNSMPWGSTYKYTIPKSIDDNITNSHASISERQKRFGREFFSTVDDNKKNIINIMQIIISIITIILFIVYFLFYIEII